MDLPPSVDSGVDDSVMQPVLPPLPELDLKRSHGKAAPLLRFRQDAQILKSFFYFPGPLFEDQAVFYDRALR